MKKTFSLALAIFLFGTLSVMASDRFITSIRLPSGQTAVIAEGEFEARSIGSFSIRLYQAATPGDETTFFIRGLIHARDGVVEKVVLSDIDGEGQPEIIVIVRSAGTGGYLSAHAFAVGKKQQLILCSTVEGLQSDADPVAALKKSAAR
jgi:hypothetical protein